MCAGGATRKLSAWSLHMFRYAMQIHTSLHAAVVLASLMRDYSQGKALQAGMVDSGPVYLMPCGCTGQLMVIGAVYSQVDGNGQIVSRKPGPQDKVQ